MTRLHLGLHGLIARRPRSFLVVVGIVVLILSSGLARARIDTSFRPLFADRGAEVEETRRFEAVFGQPSGAHLGVVLHPADPLSPAFLVRLSRLSTELERLDHVVEVISLARLAVPDWDGPRVRGQWLVAPEELDAGRGGERLSALLREHPEVARELVSNDGGRTLLLARVDLPLADLRGRREVIRSVRDVVSLHLGPDMDARFVGVSVVEEAYARIVLGSLGVSFGLTTLAVLLVLTALFRRPVLVLTAMAGVSLATPAALGLSTLLGRDITILGSVVPIMILVIGVADAIHMLESFDRELRRGSGKDPAIRAMVADMAVPCLLTTVTTALGFGALGVARISAVRHFGIDVAMGVCLVYALNVATIPALLHLAPQRWLRRPARRISMRPWPGWLAGVIGAHPGTVVLVTGLGVAGAAVGLGRLGTDQRFNEELSPDHPVRADQALVESAFGGFLGPEVVVRRRDGGSLLSAESLPRLRAFVDSITVRGQVHRVGSVFDLMPPGVPERVAANGLDALRGDPLLGPRTREVVAPGAGSAALLVRTGDIGTAGARRLAHEIAVATDGTLGAGFEVRIVGQWWLAQRGMDALVTDLVRSLFMSALLVLPLVLLFLRNGRLFLVSLLPNLLPIVLALAFMGWMGITLRIGTAVVLAVALGIAVDDTLHLLVRLGTASTDAPADRVRRALEEAGRPIVTTTLVLVAGFASMRMNPLLAIQDMGSVGVVALSAALVSDLVLAPALFLLVCRSEVPVRTSPGTAAYVPLRTSGLSGERYPGYREPDVGSLANPDRPSREDEP